MKTGIFIRFETISGHWESLDIADKRIPDSAILTWLRSRGGINTFAENCVMLLIGRNQIKEDK
jgi:hypothetical protein